jgi:hypothetical protein
MARPAYGGHRTCESCRWIDVRLWHREGRLSAWQRFSCAWTRRGVRCGEIGVRTELDAVVLIYKVRSEGHDWQSVEQRVLITWTPCRFGGRRPWFVCPASSGGRYCGRRVAVLYGAGELFACRRCCGLVYASQQESPHDRSLSQAQKIRFRLGGSPSTFDAFPEKPKRMHRSTYDRLRARGEKVEAVYWDLTDRWLSRPTKHHRA